MKTAVVTGASGGIGSAIARRLARDGFAVIAGYHSSRSRAEALVADLDGEGHSARQISVLEPSSLSALRAHLEEHHGSLEVLVNCAGMTRPVPHDDLDELDDELIDAIFMTNWRGPFAAVRALRPLLERGTDAVIVNISSVAAVTGLGSNVAYCASKAGLDSMTRSLARALAPAIRVISVSPGWVTGEYADRMPAEILDAQRAATPLGRLAAPEDVADAVSVAVNDLLFTTGIALPVDGGRPLESTTKRATDGIESSIP